MKWLQWSTSDLENGLGGVEVHARCLARELSALGIDAHLSRDPEELKNGEWDVIQFHGSGLPLTFRISYKATRVMTLHGTTLGRMAACHEWLWVGGYHAALRETVAISRSDIVLSVHPKLSLLKYAEKLGKKTAVCWNGWDSGVNEPLSAKTQEDLEHFGRFWTFIARGSDPVKGANRIPEIQKIYPDFKLVVAPGEGVTENSKIYKTGRLTPGQVRSLLSLSEGLLISSLYEGNSLIVLEALANGVPVVSTKVGAVEVLPAGLEGLFLAESGDPKDLIQAIQSARDAPGTKTTRALSNQKLLPSWRQVAECALNAVQESKRKNRE